MDVDLQRAFNEWENLPMPALDQNHIFDRPKVQLEDEAIRSQIAWVARKYGVTFKALDKLIENMGVQDDSSGKSTLDSDSVIIDTSNTKPGSNSPDRVLDYII